MLFANMSEKDHIVSLPLAHWAASPRTKPTRCNLHDTAEKLDRPIFFPGINEGKPHPLPGSVCLHAREGALARKEA